MVTPNRRQRGQLVLIAAILVATSILGAVVLLNTVHSSPDLSAQTDAQSVSNSERVADQIQSELYHVFRGASTPDRHPQLPYADEAELETAVGNFSEVVTLLAATNTSTILDVEYVDGEAVVGAVTYQEAGTDEVDTQTILEDVGDEIPRLFVNISDVDSSGWGVGPSVVLNDSDASAGVIQARETPPGQLPSGQTEGIDVRFHGDEVDNTEYEALKPPVEIELVHGAGEIRSASQYNRTTDIADGFDDFGDIDTVDVANGASNEWAFEISAADAECPDGLSDNCIDNDDVDDIDINPTFNIGYQDSNIAYNSEFTLYERDDS